MARWTNPDEGVKVGNDWFGVGNDQSPMRQHHSKSSKRKMASAMIAKIPLPLSRFIAATFKDRTVNANQMPRAPLLVETYP